MKTMCLSVIAFCLATVLSAQTSSLHPTVPVLRSAALPTYPDVWRAGHLMGKVVAVVTVKYGRVIRVERVAGNSHLFDTTRRNIETWKFSGDSDAVVTVTFTYEIAGEESEELTNPQVEMLPTLDVHLTARPFKHGSSCVLIRVNEFTYSSL